MPERPLPPLPSTPDWERHILGRKTQEWVIRQDGCAMLDGYALAEIEHFDTDRHFRVSRRTWPFAMVLLVTGGQGQVRSGAEAWVVLPGQVLLLPADRPYELRAGSQGWNLSVLHYRDNRIFGSSPRVPHVLAVHARPLEALITAFRREWESDREPYCLRQLLDLIHTKILRFFNPAQNAGRLWPVWQKVREQPGQPWTLSLLAQHAHLSPEHVRRLSLLETTRSPMEQVCWLRMQEAARHLSTGDAVIDEVSHLVGFESERAFRAAFARFFFTTPGSYRAEQRQTLNILNTLPITREAPLPRRSTPAEAYQGAMSATSWWMAPLAEVMNAFTTRGEYPWFGDIPLQRLRPGRRRIHGVPFLIRSETAGPNFLHITSRVSRPATQSSTAKSVSLPIQRRARTLYFLHACGWGSEFGHMATYRIHFSDDSMAEKKLIVLGTAHPDERDGVQANLQDWYFSYEPLHRLEARPFDALPASDQQSPPQYLYTLEWNCPKPEKKIVRLEAETAGNSAASLAVLAISLAL